MLTMYLLREIVQRNEELDSGPQADPRKGLGVHTRGDAQVCVCTPLSRFLAGAPTALTGSPGLPWAPWVGAEGAQEKPCGQLAVLSSRRGRQVGHGERAPDVSRRRGVNVHAPKMTFIRDGAGNSCVRWGKPAPSVSVRPGAADSRGLVCRSPS